MDATETNQRPHLLRDFFEVLYSHGDAPALNCREGQQVSYGRLGQYFQELGTLFALEEFGQAARLLYRGRSHRLLWLVALRALYEGIDFLPINPDLTKREEQALVELLPKGAHRELSSEDLDRWWNQLERLEPASFDAFALQGVSPAMVLIATGGSSGQARIVAHTVWNLGINALMFAEATSLNSRDRVLVAAPPFHVAGFSALTLAALIKGACLSIIDRFQPTEVAQRIEAEKITALLMVPTMWQLLFSAAEHQGFDLSSLNIAISGGAITSPELILRASKLGVPLRQGYGMTEAGPMVTLSSPWPQQSEKSPFVVSAGRAPEQVEVFVDAPSGQEGEILVSGPQMAPLYYTKAGPIAQVQDFYRTGDRGLLGTDGELYVLGRKDEMIITGGENVYPEEINQLLREDPGVIDAAVFGVPDALWGEVVTAFFVLPEANLDEISDEDSALLIEPILDSLRGKLAKFKVPRYVRLIDELPRTPAGKISAARLRALWYQKSGKLSSASPSLPAEAPRTVDEITHTLSHDLSTPQ